MLKKVKKFSLSEIEKEILDFWRENNIFQEAEKKNEKGKEFVFYEGPPTANGQPGIHHVLSRAFKDVVLRYQTMKGKKVLRRGGWDTHGLPVEIEVEKKLGINSKEDIEKYGIAKFNKKCKESVWKYKDDWENLTERMGFWIDMDNPYITYENSYIETLWWIIKKINEKGFLYKGHKVVPWCTRCGTALSSHELAQGYKTVIDNSVTVKFQIVGNQFSLKTKESDECPKKLKTYILSWTTTPWTLPGNIALAVGDKIDYVIVRKNDEDLIIAKSLAHKIAGETIEIIKEIKGKELVGLEYKPLFDVQGLTGDKSYKIYSADFVTTEDGTGVVHTAVMYGEDDYSLGNKVGLPQHHTVDESGRFKDDVRELSGMYVKDEETERKIFEILKKNNNLFKVEDYEHEYPFCWRCSSHVLYYARDSWFIKMSKLRDALLKENEKINWIPEHTKQGRFGEWLKNVKDWAISRERYWGTPLPVWQCQVKEEENNGTKRSGKCENTTIIGSFKELAEKAGAAKNVYFFARHGEAESNVENVVNSDPKNKEKSRLTDKGEAQSKVLAKKIKKENVNFIYASDFMRTKQTAEIISKETGIKAIFDERLREINAGDFDGRPVNEYREFFKNDLEKFFKKTPNGENLRELALRVWSFVSEMEKIHKDKKILVVAHEYIVWMAEMLAGGWGEERAVYEKSLRKPHYFGNAEVLKLKPLMGLPRNEYGIVDPHRPYVDEITFPCEKCGGKMKRIKEVADVWFDSGAMPFAQAHYPFADKNTSSSKVFKYPAEYIVEAVDQTRGWFYTLLATAVLLGREKPYKNVISLGHVLDKEGKKMSKSKGNTVNPWKIADKYGMDATRWYFYTINSPGEPTKFDENELKKVPHELFLTAYNSFKFLSTYRQEKIYLRKNSPKNNVMDRWIISRLNETVYGAETKMEAYDITGAAREIEKFVSDFSRWYIRRIRRRLQKPISSEDYDDASETLVRCLLGLTKIIAPFAPFFSEALYESLRDFLAESLKKSVHLENWPKSEKKLIDKNLMEEMALIREIASEALAEREKVQIKVRQPLRELRIGVSKLKIKNKELIEVLEEEVNVKTVIFEEKSDKLVQLDTEITSELKEEGMFRELIRAIQQMRAKANLLPSDKIILGIKAEKEILEIIEKNKESFKDSIGAEDLIFSDMADLPIIKETTKIGTEEILATIWKGKKTHESDS